MPVFELEANGKSYEVDAPDMQSAVKALGNVGDWRDAEASSNLAAIESARTTEVPKSQPSSPVRTGSLLPISRNIETGQVTPSVPEMITSAVTLPGDVYAGRVDPSSPDATGRVLNLAALANPLAPGRGMGAVSPAPRPTPRTTEQIKQMAQAAYKDAEAAGLAIQPHSYNRLVAGIVHKAKKEGIDPKLTPDSHAAVSRLVQEMPRRKAPDAMAPVTGVVPEAPTKTFSLENIDTLRQVVGAARKTKSPDKAADRRIANIVSDRIDEWLETLKPSDVAAGDAARAVSSIKTARNLWATMRKAETIDNILESAMDKVGANYTSAGLQTALRQEFKALKKKPYEMRRFTPEERSIINSITRGASIENTLRWLGKLAPTGNISTAISAGSGFLAGGPAGAIGLPIAGAVARGASAKLGMDKVNKLDELIRLGADKSAY